MLCNATCNSPDRHYYKLYCLTTGHQICAREVLSLPLREGAHLNLAACASGQLGKFVYGRSAISGRTNEVMGLVPAFLLAGAGSVTGTIWPIRDDYAAEFGVLFWKAAINTSTETSKGKEERISGESLIDLAIIVQIVVLKMRETYKVPSAWAGFVLSGFWQLYL